MYAQLGNIIFEGLKSFTGYKAKYTATLAQHALINGKPKLQKTGDALDELAIDMRFHRSFCIPETEIAALKKAKSDGAILALISGTGELIGNFVISEITTDIGHAGPDGLIVDAMASVVLFEAYDPEQIDTATAAAKKIAFANAANSPLTENNATASQGPGLETAASIKEADSFQDRGEKSLNQAKSNTDLRDNEMRKAKDSFKKVNESIDKFLDGLTKIRGTVNNLVAMQTAAENARTSANNAILAIEANDLDGAISANNGLRQGIITLGGESAEIIVKTASRRI